MPTLQSLLRAYLGIDLVLQRDSGLAARLAHIERQQTDLLRALVGNNDGLARILAKLDPVFAKDPFDPIVQAESKAIGDAIIKRLHAEAAARDPLNQSPHQ